MRELAARVAIHPEMFDHLAKDKREAFKQGVPFRQLAHMFGDALVKAYTPSWKPNHLYTRYEAELKIMVGTKQEYEQAVEDAHKRGYNDGYAQAVATSALNSFTNSRSSS
jgi:hypothetical protein